MKLKLEGYGPRATDWKVTDSKSGEMLEGVVRVNFDFTASDYPRMMIETIRPEVCLDLTTIPTELFEDIKSLMLTCEGEGFCFKERERLNKYLCKVEA